MTLLSSLVTLQLCGPAPVNVRFWVTRTAAGVPLQFGPTQLHLQLRRFPPSAASPRRPPCPETPTAGTTTTRHTSPKRWGCRACTRRCSTGNTTTFWSRRPGLSGCRRSARSPCPSTPRPPHTAPTTTRPKERHCTCDLPALEELHTVIKLLTYASLTMRMTFCELTWTKCEHVTFYLHICVSL